VGWSIRAYDFGPPILTAGSPLLHFCFSRKAEVWTYSRSPAALRAAASASFRSKKTSHFTNTLSRIVKSW